MYFFLKYFVINYVWNFMYIYNALSKISPKWKYYEFARTINCTRKLTWVCACACDARAIARVSGIVCRFLENDLRKRREKKNIHFITNTSILYGSQTYWSFMKFYFVHIVKFCLWNTVVMLISLRICIKHSQH